MSDLFRRSLSSQDKLQTSPAPTQDTDDQSSSSSDSSASSAASVDTVRPSSHAGQAPPSHWTNYFDRELYLKKETDTEIATYHVYLSTPKDQTSPLFVCHHGAGASGLSFALLSQELRRLLPSAGILSLEARNHGSVVLSKSTNQPLLDFSLPTLSSDALSMIHLAVSELPFPSPPPTILVGHSLGGAIITHLVNEKSSPTSLISTFASNLVGYAVVDVVEGSALEALSHMRAYLSSRPRNFSDPDEAVRWHLRTRTIRDERSAGVSVPSLLVPRDPSGEGEGEEGGGGGGGGWTWRTDLMATEPWWGEWFEGMSRKFLSGRGAKLLVLAGTDRLDKDLMIGQMQGKFQLVVVPEAGHFVQEDVPEKLAGLLVEFFRRNDRGSLVLPPKVSELIAQGKKV